MNRLVNLKVRTKPVVLSTSRSRNSPRSRPQRLLDPTGAIGSRLYQTVATLISRLHPQWRRRLRYYYWRLVRLRGTPESIALGLAVGVFAGMFPLFGLQLLLAIALATLVRGHKFMAVAGTWVSNPLTYVPIYGFNLKVGKWLLGKENLSLSEQMWQSPQELMHLKGELFAIMFVGSLAVGVVCAVVSYFICLWRIRQIRRSRYRSLYSP
ncbi:MAG: DUF2062 domain-containing protein [Hormoscilla sp.]